MADFLMRHMGIQGVNEIYIWTVVTYREKLCDLKTGAGQLWVSLAAFYTLLLASKQKSRDRFLESKCQTDHFRRNKALWL